jgi:hypothetical protein
MRLLLVEALIIAGRYTYLTIAYINLYNVFPLFSLKIFSYVIMRDESYFG